MRTSKRKIALNLKSGQGLEHNRFSEFMMAAKKDAKDAVKLYFAPVRAVANEFRIAIGNGPKKQRGFRSTVAHSPVLSAKHTLK